MNDFDEFSYLAETVRPWLGQLVFVGGWAHRLYRLHPFASFVDYEAVRTRDVDVAMREDEAIEGDIGNALTTAGFVPEMLTSFTPPVIHYHLPDSGDGFYAEFIMPLRGGRLRRDGTPVAVTANKAGVTAQRLRHVDLLIEAPWTVEVEARGSGSLPLAVRVPNPVAFIAQKLLIHKKRDKRKRSQDLLYVHDTLELFGGRFDELARLWREHLVPRLNSRTLVNIKNGINGQYGDVTDYFRESARIAPQRNLDPATMQKACRYGLERIFGRP